MVVARLGFFLALRELPNPTVATGCFLALRGPPNPVNYDTKRLRLAKYFVNYSIQAPLGGSWGRCGALLGEIWGPVDGILMGLS